VGGDDRIASRLAALVKPSGTLRLLLSAAERDARAGLAAIEPDSVAATWIRHGFEVAVCREATAADVDSSRSTWAKRLGRHRDRSIWLLELRRVSFRPHGDGRRNPPARTAR
jgi:hypothetical protein